MHFVHRLFVGLSRQVVFTAVAPMHGAAPGQSRFDEHFGFAMACKFENNNISVIMRSFFILVNHTTENRI